MAGLAGDPLAYATHLREAPLTGVPAKRVLMTLDQGDPVVPNPTTGNILRAGDLADRTIYLRGLDAYAALKPPQSPSPGDLHEFLFRFTTAGITYADAGQQAAATFLDSDGQVTIDPNDLLPRNGTSSRRRSPGRCPNRNDTNEANETARLALAS